MKEKSEDTVRFVEIKEGQKVAVLEHTGCRGIVGTVVSKKGPDFTVKCDSCQKTVIPDMRSG